jgi:nitroreductase
MDSLIESPTVVLDMPSTKSRKPRTSFSKLKQTVRISVGRLFDPFVRTLHNLGARSPFMASVFYTIASGAFRREQHSVLQGKEAYSRNLKSSTAQSTPLLRRNIHRLEKGLTMRPQRNVFATEYIEETVAVFGKLISERCSFVAPNSEMQWAYDVLTNFFEATGSHPILDRARQKFLSISVAKEGEAKECAPYRRDLNADIGIGIEQFSALAHRRRSVRYFLPQSVPRELIDRAIEIAAQSPSACNRQPFVFRVIDDADLARKASVIPMGTAGYAENIPVFVVIVGQLRNYFDERDRHLIYIDGALAAMSLIYALEILGLSTCCINWPDVEDRERRMMKLLQLDSDERPVMCLAIGYPDPEGLVAYSQKKPVNQLRRFNLE